MTVIDAVTQPDRDGTLEALRARCEEQAAYVAQLGDVSGQLDAAVDILCEKAGGTREGWNTIIAERLRQRRAGAHQQT